MLIGLSPQQRVHSCDAVTESVITQPWSECPLPSVSLHPPLQDNHVRQKWDNSFWQVKEGPAWEPRRIRYVRYSQRDACTARLLLKSGKRQTLPEDRVATVGWMQQRQHQREKPTPRASIDSAANLLLFCESCRQCSNRLELKRYVAWRYAA